MQRKHCFCTWTRAQISSKQFYYKFPKILGRSTFFHLKITFQENYFATIFLSKFSKEITFHFFFRKEVHFSKDFYMITEINQQYTKYNLLADNSTIIYRKLLLNLNSLVKGGPIEVYTFTLLFNNLTLFINYCWRCYLFRSLNSTQLSLFW